MKTIRIALLLGLLALPSFAQLGNVIYRVEPNQGPVTGGTRVVITGDFRLEPVISPPCFGADVYIGGSHAQLISFATERIEVETKPYTTGRFDVVVSRCGIDAVLENGFVYGDLQWERALLPVVLRGDVPGAAGSIWRTEILGVSPASPYITTQPHLPCAVPEGCTPSGRFTLSSPAGTMGPGALFYVHGELDPVNVTLRVRDVSRQQESLGTELPVVPEDEAFGPRTYFAIPDVPQNENYRRKLRLYRIDVADPADLVVSLVRDDNSTVEERTVTLTGGRQEQGFLLQLPYAEFDIDAFPAARSVFIRTPEEGLYWGFLSVTNNITQQLTTVTP